jgi:transcriptional regulator with XRE-family HTH domain
MKLPPVGKRIKTLRLSDEITLVELADAIGTTAATLSNIENGKRLPRVDLLLKIAKYFKIPSDFLLGLTDCPLRQDRDVDAKYIVSFTQLYSRNLIRRLCMLSPKSRRYVRAMLASFLDINEEQRTSRSFSIKNRGV